jgi:hypothetical protein
MSNKRSRSKTQASADKAALKKLRASELYGGEIDLRKAPTPYQKRLLSKFSDVISGKAAAVKPANPKSYSEQFRVKGKIVIVPKRENERITISKSGKIIRQRGGKSRTIVVIKPERGVPKPAEGTAIIFVVPFRRGTQKHGEVIDWRRFSYSGLLKFFSDYLRSMSQFREWAQFIEIEEMPASYERDLDTYISGRVGDEPLHVKRSKRGTTAIRKMRRALSEVIGDDE